MNLFDPEIEEALKKPVDDYDPSASYLFLSPLCRNDFHTGCKSTVCECDCHEKVRAATRLAIITGVL